MMATPFVKDESPTGSFPPSPPYPPTPDSKSSPAAGDSPNEDNSSPFLNAFWKRNDVIDRAKMVQVEEQAVKNGLVGLYKFLATMNRHSATIPSTKGRIDKIRTIVKRKKDFTVLIGFLGSTGSGKTTIINALLGMRGLLPATTGRACTAVVVKIAFNKLEDVTKRFRADIVYITRDDWRVELEQLFQDLDPQDDDGDEGSVDAERERSARISQAFEKVKAVYPHIKSLDGLKATTVDALLNHPSVRSLLGSVNKIEMQSKADFSKCLKIYVDSGNSNGKDSAFWPLVKLVNVFVKAQILETGITLVDLPGSSDSNAARSAVASTISKELSVTCIVANIIRGIDEKNAHDLLEKITKRHLQMDGLYNNKSLCFILSQTDRDFDKTSNSGYAEDHPELREKCAADTQQISADKKKFQALQDKADAVNANIVNDKKRLREMLDQMDDIINPTTPGQKRKRRRTERQIITQATQTSNLSQASMSRLASLLETFNDTRDAVKSDESQVLSLGRRAGSIKCALWHARSRIAAECLKHRNDLSAKAIRQDFENSLEEMGREPDGDLRVFCVAAALFLSYQASQGRLSGFPTVAETQIPALRDWLIGTTLNDRSRYARAFLEDVENFVAWMQPWVNDKYGDTKMTQETREIWESDLDRKVLDLEENFSRLNLSVANSMKHTLQTNLYVKVPMAEKVGAVSAVKHAKSWASMSWNTHRCCNRGRGTWKDSKRNEYRWNEDLVYDVTTELLPAWTATFSDHLPQEFESCVERAVDLIAEFAEAAEEQPYQADVIDALAVLKDHILRTQNLLREQYTAAFEEIRKSMQASHHLAVQAVRKFLESMYAQCAAEHGKGHYSRNKATHAFTMKTDGLAMHQEGNKAVKTAIEMLLKTLPDELAVGYDAVIEQIRSEIQLFFEQNTSDGQRNSARKVKSTTKVRLQKDLLADIDTLARSWESNVQAQGQQDEDEEDERFDDERLVDLERFGDGDDGDYEGSEEEE